MLSIGLIIFFISQILTNTTAVVEITNLKCKPVDRHFAEFEYCYIKAINRTYKYFSVKAKLLQIPVTNISVNIDVMKRANGYKPFIYNVTFDACKFLREKKNPLVKYLFSYLAPFSNVDHPCPFAHDLIFEKINTLFLNDQMTKLLPLPEGEYAFFTAWMAYNVPRAYVNIYLKLSGF